MNRKSQAALFVIIGLTIVIALGYFFFRSSNKAADEISFSGSSSFQATRDSLYNFASACLKELSSEAIDQYGLENSEARIRNHILANIDTCIDFSIYEKQGFDIEKGTPRVDFEATDHRVIISLTYPMTLSRGGGKFQLEEFSYNIQRTVSAEIVDGKVTEDYQEVASDNNAAIQLSQGTSILDDEGNAVKEISLKIEDSHFEGLHNDLVVGGIVYNALPNGAKFSQDFNIIINYNDKDIPPGYSENNLAIAWYDEENDIWRSIPTEIKPDINTLVGKTNHFTRFTVVADCNAGGSQNDAIALGYIYREKLVGCEDWEKIGQQELLSKGEVSQRDQTCDTKSFEWNDGKFRFEDQLFDSKEACETAAGNESLCKGYYSNPNDVAGKGIFKFYVSLASGDACIPEDLKISVVDSKTGREMCSNGVGSSSGKPIVEVKISDAVNIADCQRAYFRVNGQETTRISANKLNELVIEFTNNVQDACLSAKAEVNFVGIGIVSNQDEAEGQQSSDATEGDCSDYGSGGTSISYRISKDPCPEEVWTVKGAASCKKIGDSCAFTCECPEGQVICNPKGEYNAYCTAGDETDDICPKTERKKFSGDLSEMLCSDEPFTFVLYGDSITNEHGGRFGNPLQSEFERYTAQFGTAVTAYTKGFPREVAFHCEDGQCSKEPRHGFESEIEPYGNTVYGMWFGMNAGPNSFDNYHEMAYLGMFDHMESEEIIPVLLTTVAACPGQYHDPTGYTCQGIGYTDSGGHRDMNELNDNNEAIANSDRSMAGSNEDSNGIYIIDIRQKMQQRIRESGNCCGIFYSDSSRVDGIHPNADAHRQIAAWIVDQFIEWRDQCE
ncbi:hypothetical protein JXC34_01940 [Candidatus Woesearchaeota archaeon]|nr:hypothetical protein [Candidatus Woesearchaeota archaeon]